MRTPKALAVAVALVAALAACSGSAPDDVAEQPSALEDLLAAHGLDGLDARDLVERLESAPGDERPQDLIASVRPTEVLVSDPQTEESMALPIADERFYLSIAPYVDQTHDCYHHSLTTCQGELVAADVQVTITDRTTGEVLVDEAAQTFDNGFVGFWLPGGIDASVSVEHDGRTAVADVSTGADDPTCLTTMQLT